MSHNSSVEKRVKDIRRNTRKKYSAEDKIRIVLEGLCGEDSIAEFCRREGLAQNLYYRWSKDVMEAGKRRLNGDTQREVNSTEVDDLRNENQHLKQLYAEQAIRNDVLKKNISWTGYRSQRYMRYGQGEKYEIIRLVEDSQLSVRRTLAELQVPATTLLSLVSQVHRVWL